MSAPSLDKLVNPRSIAVVGASERSDAIGSRVIHNLRVMGFPGAIYPVNPRYRELGELACYPSLSALPEPVDAAFLAVPAAQGPKLMEEAAQCGIPAVFINASGYADGDAEGAALQERIEATARRHGIAVSGPNNLGLINVNDKAAIWTPRFFEGVRPGPLALISQSGSVAISLGEDERKIGFSYLVTTGNEAVVTVAEYLDHFVRDDRVGAILLYLETVRRPEAFAAAARSAQRRGKPIIALKLGRSEGGRALVQAHTGSLAGEDRLYDAFFDKLGIARVRDFDEMLETALLFASHSKPANKTFVAVTLSGGEAALIADVGNEVGVEFARLRDDTLARLRPAFPAYAKIHNPIDAWGLGFNPERFGMVVDALAADPTIGTIAFSVDAPGAGGGDVPYALAMAEPCIRAAAANSEKRLIFFNNATGTGPNEEVRAALRRGRIPYLSGVRPALAAVSHFLRIRAEPAIREPASVPAGWARSVLSMRDAERFRAFAEIGIPMVETASVASVSEANEAARALGFPVVLKGAGPHLLHKSDLGLVRLGVGSKAELETAFEEVSAILARELPDASARQIYLQKMGMEGIELIVGIRNMPGFGSFVVVGLGGLFVEMIKQVSLRLGPVDEAEALAMLQETAAGRLLAGARGRGPYDAAAAAAAIAALSGLGAATLDAVSAMEINPLIVHERGVTGVDLLIEPAISQ